MRLSGADTHSCYACVPVENSMADLVHANDCTGWYSQLSLLAC